MMREINRKSSKSSKKKMGLKCSKNGKNMFSSRVIAIKMQDMALFVLSADDSKQLVTAWAKHLSATERSS